MNKEKFKPIHFIQLQDKALAILNRFDESKDYGRSPEYRKVALEGAEKVARVLVRDFRYYLDKFTFSEVEPLGLEEARREPINSEETK